MFREWSCVLPVLSCNSSVEVPLWKVLCGHSENSSVGRRGRKAVARTSKHILMFAFDPLPLNFLFISYIALHCSYSYTCLVLFVCPHLCSIKRAFNSTSTLCLEESRGVVSESFTGNSGSLLVTHSMLAIKL